MKVVLEKDAIMPCLAHAADAGYDLYSREDATIFPNCRALIDTGSIGVILFNLSGKLVDIKKGEKIAQIVIEKVYTPELEQVDELEATERGNSGFGSTGKF